MDRRCRRGSKLDLGSVERSGGVSAGAWSECEVMRSLELMGKCEEIGWVGGRLECDAINEWMGTRRCEEMGRLEAMRRCDAMGE